MIWKIFILALLSIQTFNCFVKCDRDSSRELSGKRVEILEESSQSQDNLGASESSDSKQASNQNDYESELYNKAEKGEVQKCVPMLNLPSYLNSSSAPSTPIIGPNANFSFNIGDIDMPITHSESSVNSAMKLLSSFGSQFDPDSSEPEPMDNVVKFRENRLQIQGLNISMLSIHLYTDSDSKFGIGITIKNTTLTGRFSYNGPLVLTDSKLAGYYRMSIENIYLIASSNLTKQQNEIEDDETETSEEEDSDRATVERESKAKDKFKLVTEDFRMNVSNLGYINIDIFDSKDSNKPTSNYLLRMLQRFLQRTIKRTYFTFENHIREVLERESKRSLDCELTRFTPLLDKSGVSSHHSDLAQIISGEIVRSQLNVVSLPNFEHHQNVFGSSGTINFFNGSLKGLDNINLNGETRIKLQDEHLFVNTSIGWKNLKPYYNWDLFLGSNKSKPMSSGFVSFDIKGIDFDAVITKGLKPDTRISVEQLVIRKLESPKMDISGLPGMNRVTRGMVNFFMARLKQRLASSIQPSLKQQLERSLNRMNVFV